MQTFPSYVIQKIIFVALCCIMLMLSGCGEVTTDPDAAFKAFCVGKPSGTYYTAPDGSSKKC